FAIVLLEVAEEERHVIVPGHAAVSAEVEPDLVVRVPRMPAGEGGVVVGDVAAVPAEHDAAEAEIALRRGEEFFLVDVFAAQDAVDVGDGDLYPVARERADFVEDLLGRFAIRLFHALCALSSPWRRPGAKFCGVQIRPRPSPGRRSPWFSGTPPPTPSHPRASPA